MLHIVEDNDDLQHLCSILQTWQLYCQRVTELVKLRIHCACIDELNIDIYAYPNIVQPRIVIGII